MRLTQLFRQRQEELEGGDDGVAHKDQVAARSLQERNRPEENMFADSSLNDQKKYLK